MAFKDDLEGRVNEIFQKKWEYRKGITVPDTEALPFDNVGIRLDATVLYADLANSTAFVDKLIDFRAAEIYKSYLYCAGRIINANGGAITAYDGDRVMAIYVGDSKNTSAVTTALELNWALINIINPAMRSVYTSDDYVIKHAIGIDTSTLLAVKAGVRGDTDMVWVGRAANHAAKMTTLSENAPIYMSEDVYNTMNDSVRFATSDHRNIWFSFNWDKLNRTIYFANAWRSL
jgi:class 3 adenylate cyclase